MVHRHCTMDTRLTRWARVRLVLFPALLGPAQLFLFGPLTTYARNESEFAVGFWSLAPLWLWAAALLVALLVSIGLWLPRRALQRWVAVLFVIGGLLWAQGNVLVPDLGPLYGGAPDFESLAWRTPLELGISAAAVTLAVVFARAVASVAPLASQALFALQLIVAFVSAPGLLQQPQDEASRGARRWNAPPAGIFELSRGTNIIHLVLDGFPSEIFAEAMDGQRGARDRDFSGFVFFADHLGSFRSTRGSMPAMLAGVNYRNEAPFNDFRARAWRGSSIFSVLARQGYRIHSITFHPGEHPPSSIGRRAVRYGIPTPYADRRTYERFAAAQVLDLTLFRHAPTSLKRRVYNDDRWVLQQWTGSAARQVRQSNHLAFLDDFTRRLAIASDQPVYLFLHVIPPHPPVVLDSSCTFVGQQPLTRATFAGQAACALTHVRGFLDRLRALGVYDSSAILLTADHGWALDRPDHPLRDILTPGGRLDRMASEAMPLLAVKLPGAEGPLRTSHAPTAITDVPATIAAVAGGPPQPLPGQPVFEIDAGAPRPRTFTMHSWTNADWQRPYFDALLVFDVNGRALDRDAWSFRQAILDPTSHRDVVSERLEVGLSKVQNVNGEPVRWGKPYAVTYAPFDARAVKVSVRNHAATTSRLAVTVRLDGRPVGRIQPTDSVWHTWTYPLELRTDSRSPFCIELLSERMGEGQDVLYGASFWTR
ncbi:MAG: sulfatase-like hydrolase/transferase [Acidobacteria bacterium]|nr:sulfatase-like hydrolase/transferase [Acidobacteriota bacterium]